MKNKINPQIIPFWHPAGNFYTKTETDSAISTAVDAVVDSDGAAIKEYRYKGSVADDAAYTLPFELTAPGGWGMAFCGNNEYALFRVSGVGVVTLIYNTTNVVANADTDTKFCVGSAASQDPLQFKNRLGSPANLFLTMWYV
jgi:hypothetical protein